MDVETRTETPTPSRTARTVVHVITTLEAGGAQTLLLDTVRRLDPSRYRAVIVTLHGETMEVEALRPAVIDLSRRGTMTPWVLIPLVRILRKERAQIVHTHLVHADLLGGWAAWLAGVPRTVTTRHYGIDHKEGTWLYRMADRSARSADAVVAVSHAVAEHLVMRRIVPRDRIAVIPNGVDPERFDPQRRRRREDATAGVLGAAGRLHPQKGFLPLLEIFRAVLERRPEARLEIVGEGPLRPQLERRIQELGLGKAVRLLGRVPHGRMPELYAGWDLFVMPSRWEGFGLAAAEAMAMGLPVVASALEGLTELVVDGQTGHLLPPGRGGDWVERIVGLLGNVAERERMGRVGRERIVRHFSVPTMVARLERLYDRLLEGR